MDSQWWIAENPGGNREVVRECESISRHKPNRFQTMGSFGSLSPNEFTASGWTLIRPLDISRGSDDAVRIEEK